MNLASNYFFTTVRYELLLVTLSLRQLAMPMYFISTRFFEKLEEEMRSVID